MAMGPKIHAHLLLSPDGRTVTVTGPTGDWDDPYLLSATFRVVIGQVNPATGEIVLATGRSDHPYTPADGWWDAEAVVHADPPVRLHLGPASAWAIASVKALDDHYESYPWSVETRLVGVAPPPLPWP